MRSDPGGNSKCIAGESSNLANAACCVSASLSFPESIHVIKSETEFRGGVGGGVAVVLMMPPLLEVAPPPPPPPPAMPFFSKEAKLRAIDGLEKNTVASEKANAVMIKVVKTRFVVLLPLPLPWPWPWW
jgi:hypothetical protein